MSYLDDKHILKIHLAYKKFEKINAFAGIMTNEDILKDKNSRLSVQLYVNEEQIEEDNLGKLLSNWERSSDDLKKSMDTLFSFLSSG